MTVPASDTTACKTAVTTTVNATHPTASAATAAAPLTTASEGGGGGGGASAREEAERGGSSSSPDGIAAPFRNDALRSRAEAVEGLGAGDAPSARQRPTNRVVTAAATSDTAAAAAATTTTTTTATTTTDGYGSLKPPPVAPRKDTATVASAAAASLTTRADGAAFAALKPTAGAKRPTDPVPATSNATAAGAFAAGSRKSPPPAAPRDTADAAAAIVPPAAKRTKYANDPITIHAMSSVCYDRHRRRTFHEFTIDPKAVDGDLHHYCVFYVASTLLKLSRQELRPQDPEDWHSLPRRLQLYRWKGYTPTGQNEDAELILVSDDEPIQDRGYYLLEFGDNVNNLNGGSSSESVMKNSRKKKTGTVSDLPVDIVAQCVLPFLDFEQDVNRNLSRVSKWFLKCCDTDARWIPIVAPPNLCYEVLNVKTHSFLLRPLYREYQTMIKAYKRSERDVMMRHPMREYFHLGPWYYCRNTMMHYPTPWLHFMIYKTKCPSLTPPKTIDEMANCCLPPNTFWYWKYPQCVSSRPHVTPVFAEEGKNVRSCTIHIKPSNISNRPQIPEYDSSTMRTWNAAVVKLLQCYGKHYRVVVNEVINRNSWEFGHCSTSNSGNHTTLKFIGVRYDGAALGAHDIVFGFQSRGVRTYGATVGAGNDKKIVVNVIRPTTCSHNSNQEQLFGKHGGKWFLSTGLITALPFSHLHTYLSIWLSWLAQGIGGLEGCANIWCVLNISKSSVLKWETGVLSAHADNSPQVPKNRTEFHGEQPSLLFCPQCIRKLQLAGVLDDDIPDLIRRLSTLFSEEPFASMCKNRECVLLQEYR